MQIGELKEQIKTLAGLPPGKKSKFYFTKEQLRSLYFWMCERNQAIKILTDENDSFRKAIHSLEKQVEGFLQNGKPIPTPESKKF